jgi:hypothetical protein
VSGCPVRIDAGIMTGMSEDFYADNEEVERAIAVLAEICDLGRWKP